MSSSPDTKPIGPYKWVMPGWMVPVLVAPAFVAVLVLVVIAFPPFVYWCETYVMPLIDSWVQYWKP